jgi:hypothetical protein
MAAPGTDLRHHQDAAEPQLLAVSQIQRLNEIDLLIARI